MERAKVPGSGTAAQSTDASNNASPASVNSAKPVSDTKNMTRRPAAVAGCSGVPSPSSAPPVVAAKSIGTRQIRVIIRHIFPNVLSPIIVSATLGIAGAIINESALSFLGLGFPSDFPTWGRLLYDGKDFLTLTPAIVFWPGLFISLTVLSVNFIGDGLRDALDPRIRSK